jgi:hypothetical protein
MKRKLDIIKAKAVKGKGGEILFKTDSTEQIEALEKLNESIESLHELIKNKGEVDFSELTEQLIELRQAMDVGEQLADIKEAFLENRQETVDLLNISGLKQYLEKASKIQSPIPTQVETGLESTSDMKPVIVIEAPGAGKRLKITDLIIANTSDHDTHIVLQDGEKDKLVYPAPFKSGAIHALKTPMPLSLNSPLRFTSLAAVNRIFVSAIAEVTK